MSAVAELEGLARERGWKVRWIDEDWSLLAGWTIRSVEVSARGKLLAYASIFCSRGTNATSASESVAKMILPREPRRGARLAA